MSGTHDAVMITLHHDNGAGDGSPVAWAALPPQYDQALYLPLNL